MAIFFWQKNLVELRLLRNNGIIQISFTLIILLMMFFVISSFGLNKADQEDFFSEKNIIYKLEFESRIIKNNFDKLIENSIKKNLTYENNGKIIIEKSEIIKRKLLEDVIDYFVFIEGDGHYCNYSTLNKDSFTVVIKPVIENFFLKSIVVYFDILLTIECKKTIKNIEKKIMLPKAPSRIILVNDIV